MGKWHTQLDTINESQEVSPFPASDHEANITRRALRHRKHNWDCVAAVERLPALHYSVDWLYRFLIFEPLLTFTTAGDWDCVAAVERLPPCLSL